MPRNLNIKKVMLIGSGPIIISQGCEFDYAGTQACKALKEEGCYVILVNPNPATIMTDPDMADVTYIEPLVPSILIEIIEKERPDVLLPTMGGQTALNVTLELSRLGILDKYKVNLIGVDIATIKKAEDRKVFNAVLRKANIPFPRSITARSIQEIHQKKISFGYPRIVRTSFTLGGSGSGIVESEEDLFELVKKIFDQNQGHEILIEESLRGWKEFELEVMADAIGNFIVVCPIENLDPMGIHTGDSITVAPTMTLTDKEYQQMRNTAKKLMAEIGMTSGGCNIQFAINPKDGRIFVIEINPRVSRSSALASKATGFPIAKVATKISLGYTLNELLNDVTQGAIPASFEPTIDYVVVKIPRFNFNKFPGASSTLSTQMKSIGEVMGIGRTFSEALQKAIRSLEGEMRDLSPIVFSTSNNHNQEDIIYKKLSNATEDRIFYLFEAFRQNWSLKKIGEITEIDPWFLHQIKAIVDIEEKVKCITLSGITNEDMLFLKQNGFSDYYISIILNVSEGEIYKLRKFHKISPVYKRIDSCAAEFPTKTSYLYSTYEDECEANPSQNKKIIILGSGSNRIGQGIEFDYCCVHAALTVRELGYESIMINCNPETVSTDYDCCTKLYFEPLTLENIREIIDLEKPSGILSQFGGQTSLGLAQELCLEGYHILGTHPENIKKAEDRLNFKDVLDKLKIKQLKSKVVSDIEEALIFGNQIGYPLIFRSSFVIGGSGFAKIHNDRELIKYFESHASSLKAIFVEKFINDALEVDVDAISDGTDITICGIMEQFEPAGIHSGDSTCIFPNQNLSVKTIDKIIDLTQQLAFELKIRGFMNLQFLIKDEDIYVLEVNPRASRTIPFISKATDCPFVNIATKVILGVSLKEQNCPLMISPLIIAIKMPVFSFEKFPGVKRDLGVEMKSTGEVMVVGNTVREALDKINLYKMPPHYSSTITKTNVYALQNYSLVEQKNNLVKLATK